MKRLAPLLLLALAFTPSVAAAEPECAWHSMARYQIISAANPTKRAKGVADFDKTFASFITKLAELEQEPQKVLKEKVAE